jgi:hypothetical protein
MTSRAFALGVVALALALAVFAAPLASRRPDGLQHVASMQGFAQRAADRGAPRVGRASGTLGVLVLGSGISAALLRRRRRV